MNINNNTTNTKKEILVRIARLMLERKLEEGVHFIPREMAPKNKQPIRCCIFHDREIIRMRTLARMGFSIENYDEEKTLATYAKEALEREKPTWPMLTVLHDACNACVRTHFMITNACQACDARPCKMNCPRQAISIDTRAHIDEEKCVNCGRCLENCPYHAIIKIPVPCEESCPVGAIKKDENGHETIDYHKCIFCGNCMRECPFGAMMDKGQLVDVINKIMLKKNKVVALYAPSIASQFNANPLQLKQALLLLGFDKVIEVAVGADICAKKEAGEFEERMARGDKMMTTSCCSSYVRAVRIHVPELIPCVSDTRSPMHYTAEIAKNEDKDCTTVFIGPCISKRREAMDDDFVDYVLSAEEINAFLIAKEIDITKIEVPQDLTSTSDTENDASSLGRNFARTGGVLEAVKANLKDKSILRPTTINGLNKSGINTLKRFGLINAGKIPTPPDCPNLIEVMACEGGCIAGPSVVKNIKESDPQLTKYVSFHND